MEIQLSAVGFDYVTPVREEHVVSYGSDPQKEYDGLKHGILQLSRQPLINGVNMTLEPLPIPK